MPATVQAVLAARIDRLPPEDKRLLQTAATIGTDVPLPVLQAIAELSEAELHRGLARLQAAEFLYETRLFPEREYTFKHALTHEVAYGSLLQERRRGLHARIVEALEGLAGDRGTSRSNDWPIMPCAVSAGTRPSTYCRDAGSKAFLRSANREAVLYLEQTLLALAHCPESRAQHEQALDVRLTLGAATDATRRTQPDVRASQCGGGPGTGPGRSTAGGAGGDPNGAAFLADGRF